MCKYGVNTESVKSLNIDPVMDCVSGSYSDPMMMNVNTHQCTDVNEVCKSSYTGVFTDDVWLNNNDDKMCDLLTNANVLCMSDP